MKHWVFRSVFISLAYLFFAKMGLYLASINNNASPIWPATGVAILSLVIFGRRFLPCIFIGALAANSLTASPFNVNIIIAIGNSLEAYAGAAFFSYLYKRKEKFGESEDLLINLLVSSIASIISAFFGQLALITGEIISISEALASFFTWWIGDTLGGFYLIPFYFYLKEKKQSFFDLTFKKYLFIIISLLFSFIVLYFKIFEDFVFLILPIFILSSIWFEQFFNHVILCLISIIAISITANNHGPFIGSNLNENLIHLQLFLLGVSASSMMLPKMLSKQKSSLVILSLLVGWTIGNFLFWNFRSNEEKRDREKFDDLISLSEQIIAVRISRYINAITAGVGFFTALKDPSPDQWDNFVAHLKITSHYDGIKGLGFISKVKNEDLIDFTNSFKLKWNYDLTIKQIPNGDYYFYYPAADHYIITHTSPKEIANQAVGFDVGSESKRRAAIEKADSTKSPIASNNVLFPASSGPILGFILYLPFFKNEEENKSDGLVYAPVSIESFFKSIQSEISPEITIKLLEKDSSENTKVIWPFQEKDQTIGKETKIRIASKDFYLGWNQSPKFTSSKSTVSAWVSLACMIIVLLVNNIINMLQKMNSKVLSLVHERTKTIESLEKERKENHERLEQSQRRLSFALEGSSDGLWDWDLKSGEMYLSSKLAEMFGVPPIIKIKSMEDMKAAIHPDDFERTSHSILNHIGGKTIRHEAEARIKMADKSWKWFLTRGKISEKDGNGQPIRMTGVHIDISKLKAQEEEIYLKNKALITATSAKSEFLATMSHEIRTPLNGIIGAIDLLSKDEELIKEKKRYFDIILHSSKVLMDIVNDILDFSKIEAGELKLESIPFSLKDILKEQIIIFSPQAEKKQIKLTQHIDKDLILERIGDPARLSQILLNLIGNAIKFTSKGFVMISLKRRKTSENSFSIEILDTGIGIKTEQQKMLFEPFKQADGSTSRRYGGTGLGLAICKRLIEAMKGSIGLESIYGDGSRFWINLDLPIYSHEKSVEKIILPAETLNFNEAEKPKILVAEDNDINQFLIESMLKKEGYSCTIVANGAQVLEAYKKEFYDIIFMDCQMPEIDGYEATRLLRIEEKNKKRSYIIALTANAMSEEKTKCFDVGMDDYLSKPINRDHLKEKINKWFQIKKAV